MKRRLGLIFFVVLLSLFVVRSVPSVFAQGSVQLQFKSVQFFESPFNAAPQSDRQYQTRFPASTTRYVFFSALGKNLLYRNRAHRPLVRGRYYKPDGSFMGEAKVEVEVPSDWESADLWNGWGWDQPGRWTPGNYRVEIWYGDSKVGEGNFTIYDDRTPTTSSGEKVYLEFESVRFYEGGSTDVPDSQRVYKNDFARGSSRYIYFQVYAKNLLYRNRSQRPFVRGRYYYPDGSFMGEAKVNVEIPSDWDKVDLWNAWGWNEPGNWSLGTFRVDIMFGDTKVAEGRFTVYDDRK